MPGVRRTVVMRMFSPARARLDHYSLAVSADFGLARRALRARLDHYSLAVSADFGLARRTLRARLDHYS
ncbi:MAG: hypothetical protein ABIV94_00040, partial [Acidimicrobiales bacterium]